MGSKENSRLSLRRRLMNLWKKTTKAEAVKVSKAVTSRRPQAAWHTLPIALARSLTSRRPGWLLDQTAGSKHPSASS